MKRKIRIDNNESFEVISINGTTEEVYTMKEVDSLPDAFSEFEIDIRQLTGDQIDHASEVWENGTIVIDIDEIERAIFEFVAEDIK